MDPLRFESLFGVQSTQNVLYHHCQFLKRCFPSGVLFVPYIREACGELNPNNFLSNRISISSSARAVVAFGLFSSPCRFSCFCFAFNAFPFYVKSLSLKSVDANGVQH